MEYIAHLREDGTVQKLRDHLNAVAEMAAEFAKPFGAEKQAYLTGILHDMGKYAKTSQYHMQHPNDTPPCDHSTAGAIAALKKGDMCAAIAIAGHHSGMPEPGQRGDGPQEPTMMGRKKRTIEDASAWAKENKLPEMSPDRINPDWMNLKDNYIPAFYTRMLYSCLVDADFLDTEKFMQGGKNNRGGFSSPTELLNRMRKKTEPWLLNPGNELNRCRTEILKECYQKCDLPQGFYTMTVPTGGGKTTASLAFALSHAAEHDLQRVIYVIPYTSIIEQNAEVFRQLVGDENVLEHHSQVEMESCSLEEAERWNLAAENWDAPLIVTTAVQFFESLHAYKPSRCRKLHNISGSVIILDEAQMMPLPLLKACVAALTELTRHYGVTVVLCTATQPALNEVIQEFAPEMEIPELIPDLLSGNPIFQRNVLQWDGAQTEDEIAREMTQNAQCLCIVNRRASAQNLYKRLPEDGRFHLTTMMVPEDRSKTLDIIRERLKKGLSCRVVSTSLIECGVDVDFPEVWREEAGLDSILQAAGRCNREGKRPYAENKVHVFNFTGESVPVQFRMQCEALQTTYQKYADCMNGAEAISAYFLRLRHLLGDSRLDLNRILDSCKKLAFRQIEKDFKMIEQNTIPVYIETEDNTQLIQQLRYGKVTRGLMRKLGRYAVNIYPQQLAILQGNGHTEITVGEHRVIHGAYIDILDGQMAILTDKSLYTGNMGLQTDQDGGKGLFI